MLKVYKRSQLFNLLIICSLLLSNKSSAAEFKFDENSLSFHGYTRAAVASSENGKTAAIFKAPGAGAKFRLGNESDTLIRLRLNYHQGEINNDQPHVNAEVAIQGYQAFGNTDKLSLDKIPKAYLEFVNYLDKDISFWLGRRWYERKGSYINDYWWINSGQWAQMGIGVEGIKFHNAEFKAAIFRHEDDVYGLDEFKNITGTLNSTTLDLRLLDINLSKNTRLNFWGLIAARHEKAELGYESHHGYGLGAWFDVSNVLGGKNTLAFTYRVGPAMHQKTTNAKPINETMGYNLAESSMWEVNNSWTFDEYNSYAVQWLMLARSEKFGNSNVNGDTIDWYSTGVRPVFYINNLWSYATEMSVDYVDNDIQNLKGSLAKVSFALQASPEQRFMSRPVLRFFVTYAKWSNELVGYVGNSPDDAPYGTSDNGWTLGGQIEHIW